MTHDRNELEEMTRREAEPMPSSHGAPTDPEEDGWTQPESSAQKAASPSQSWLAPEGS